MFPSPMTPTARSMPSHLSGLPARPNLCRGRPPCLPAAPQGRPVPGPGSASPRRQACYDPWEALTRRGQARRSEEHTSELQSLTNLVCRLLLEKKKKNKKRFLFKKKKKQKKK